MKKLSSYLQEDFIEQLKAVIGHNQFPGISFENAMKFILTDGILPETDLSAKSFLHLEQWIRGQEKKVLFYSTSDLKNKTGEILTKVAQGKTVVLLKHGRIVGEIKGAQ